ncbi:hypothetical protein IU443_07865 [Nocardia farcinica]|uniref:hypothetical protein n=1 Tax=Nocardia TaxID=1817 RepID=UPI000BEF9050|nr:MULTISPECIES: hypothetical protein [Nocardia]MBA4859023.1 hypothetical protein [Nocardia farcinica]MBC9819323.1 hypothetical protein [Nocardia farcinica]MBF6187124.1 hypothetical protein [Nocardia farcinica]MBF6262788.1 hypothetical protein [Nocardia farcinica]MBF6281292.1 hypothetical protein [Nocardia farcinica]
MADEPAPVRDNSTFAGLSQVAHVVGQFVAPATLLAGLLFYWGFFHARGFCGYLGVKSDVLGLSTTDYVMRSADGLFVPLAVVGVTALALLWGWGVLPNRVRRAPWPPWLLVVLAGLAVLLIANGASRLLFEWWGNRRLAVAPACLIAGVLLLRVVVRARQSPLHRADGERGAVDRSVAPLEWGLVLLLVGGAFFWGATDYSMAVGTGRAATYIAERLAKEPGVTVYSEKNLELAVPDVTATACTDPAAAYRFRYEGLVLVMSTADNFVLLPRTWKPGTGTAVVLPRSGIGATRVEYSGTDAGPRPAC